MEESGHPVEKEVLRRREGSPRVQPDTGRREREIVKRFMEDYITGRRWRQPYQRQEQEYRGRAVWPPSLEAGLRTGEEENPMTWLPGRTAQELDRLSLSGDEKKRQKEKMKTNKFGAAVHVQHFLRKQRRIKKERKKKQQLSLNTPSN